MSQGDKFEKITSGDLLKYLKQHKEQKSQIQDWFYVWETNG